MGGGPSQLRGALNYYGLAPKFELGFNYGGGWQSLYGFLSEVQVRHVVGLLLDPKSPVNQ